MSRGCWSTGHTFISRVTIKTPWWFLDCGSAIFQRLPLQTYRVLVHVWGGPTLIPPQSFNTAWRQILHLHGDTWKHGHECRDHIIRSFDMNYHSRNLKTELNEHLVTHFYPLGLMLVKSPQQLLKIPPSLRCDVTLIAAFDLLAAMWVSVWGCGGNMWHDAPVCSRKRCPPFQAAASIFSCKPTHVHQPPVKSYWKIKHNTEVLEHKHIAFFFK